MRSSSFPASCKFSGSCFPSSPVRHCSFFFAVLLCPSAAWLSQRLKLKRVQHVADWDAVLDSASGNAYSVLYQQQETIYFALFQEVSEAKSLLEQTALICQGRPFYPSVLRQIKLYIRNDLRRLDIAPVELIAQVCAVSCKRARVRAGTGQSV